MQRPIPLANLDFFEEKELLLFYGMAAQFEVLRCCKIVFLQAMSTALAEWVPLK